MNLIVFILVFISFECISGRGPPILLPQIPNLQIIDVNENESFELHCPVRITPDLSVQWLKNNEELDPMWSSSNVLIRRFLLKIQNVNINDGGLYKCNVVNGFGNVQAQFQVNVKSNGSLFTTTVIDEQQNGMDWDVDEMNGEPPEFLSQSDGSPNEPTKVIQPEGTTVQLKCLASGKPSPDIRWKKNGKILSEDEYGITQSQILNIKDLRQSDTGNYTCEVFNSFGSINATYVLVITEKINFFGDDPKNVTVEIGSQAILNCRVQTTNPTTKIQWLKKLDSQQVFRPDAIVFDSEQYEIIEQIPEQIYTNNILSKSLNFPQINLKQSGQYICLIHNDKATNYKKAFIHIIDHVKGIINNNNILIYVILIPLLILGLILFFIFCFRHHYHHKKTTNYHHYLHTSDSFKSSIKPRQPLIHQNGVIIPSTTTRTSNDYLADSVDSIPVSRQNHQQRSGPSASSDLGSIASSNLYYARVQPV